MKTLSLLTSIGFAAALAVAPLSLELSASLFVLIGVVALMAGEYGQEQPMVGTKA